MNPEQMFGSLVFFAIGLGYFSYAKKNSSFVLLACAVFLLCYGYFCENTWQTYLYGGLATVLPWLLHFWRNR